MERSQNILFQWATFQFYDVPKGIMKAWRNFLLFNLNYFSIKVLIRTLFSHWHKYKWASPRGFEPGKWIEAKISNFISRFLGAIVRLGLISLGIFTEIFVFFAGLLALSIWIVLPAILIYGLVFSFGLIF